MVRHAELKEQAGSLPRESEKRKTPEKRIRTWSRTGFRKRTKETQDKKDVFDESGKKIGERHSVRKRTIAGQSGERRSDSPTGG